MLLEYVMSETTADTMPKNDIGELVEFPCILESVSSALKTEVPEFGNLHIDHQFMHTYMDDSTIEDPNLRARLAVPEGYMSFALKSKLVGLDVVALVFIGPEFIPAARNIFRARATAKQASLLQGKHGASAMFCMPETLLGVDRIMCLAMLRMDVYRAIDNVPNDSPYIFGYVCEDEHAGPLGVVVRLYFHTPSNLIRMYVSHQKKSSPLHAV